MTTNRNHQHSHLSNLVAAAIIALMVSSVIAGVSPTIVWAVDEDEHQTGIVNTEDARLNVRSGPGSGFAIVAKLDPGVVVEIVGESEDGLWVQLHSGTGEVSGWAAREFVTSGASDGVRATSAALREGPNFGPRFIPAGISRSFSSRSTEDDGAPPESAQESTDSAGEIDTDSVAGSTTEDSATESSAQSAVVDAPELELPEPTPAATQAVGSDTAAEEEPAATATPRPTLNVPTAVTQPDRMNVRAGPGTNYGIVASVAAGSEMEILGLGPLGEWYQVNLPGQEEPAWLFAGLVDALGPLDGLQRVAEADVPPPPEPAPATDQPAVASAAVVAAPPPSGAGFFGYGIQAHMLGGDAGTAMTSISDLGFNWVKQQVQWKDFQPQAGAIGMGQLGGIVSASQGRGINVLFSVVNAPQWSRESGFDGSVGGPPADPQTYANFVGSMAGAFCGTSLKAIEIWNEQNLHYEWGNKPLDPAEYMNLLRPAYASIKAACPEMLVISGALTPAASNGSLAMDDFAYLEGMYQNGLASYSDGIGAHPSGYNVPASVGWESACATIQQTGNTFNGACDTPHHSWAFRSTMEGYRNIMTVYGDTNKRIWPTEFGWAAGGAFDPRYAYANDNGFDEQAAWTVEAYQMMKNWGWVGPAFLWNLNFRVVADGTEKAQWGIVGNDWQPLPTYHALQAMSK